jgi:hypothetical protein
MTEILDILADCLQHAGPHLADRGIAVEMTISTDDGPRRAARVDATSERGLGQLLLWETGELDLVIGDVASGEVLLDEHREVSSALGIRDALATIEHHLATKGSPSSGG